MLDILIRTANRLGIGASADVASAVQTAPSAHADSAAPLIVAGRIELANDAVAERLWRLALALPSEATQPMAVFHPVRHNVLAMLTVDSLDAKYFPLRPTLLPQLLQALNDPQAAAERLSRVVAHDPVLTADALRLPNSGSHRTSTRRIDSIQRAIVICGVDAMRGVLASAMLRPVFRATTKNFPRLPRMLWERTERAVRAAELFALETAPADRFDAHLGILLRSMGPLVVHSVVVDVYARNPGFSPSGALCLELIQELAPKLALKIAQDWQVSPRLLAALEASSHESLTAALQVGEFLGTLAYLESQTVITQDERVGLMAEAGIASPWTDRIWASLTDDP